MVLDLWTNSSLAVARPSPAAYVRLKLNSSTSPSSTNVSTTDAPFATGNTRSPEDHATDPFRSSPRNGVQSFASRPRWARTVVIPSTGVSFFDPVSITATRTEDRPFLSESSSRNINYNKWVKTLLAFNPKQCAKSWWRYIFTLDLSAKDCYMFNIGVDNQLPSHNILHYIIFLTANLYFHMYIFHMYISIFLLFNAILSILQIYFMDCLSIVP